MSFSQRNHLENDHLEIQKESVSIKLRNRLWNAICIYYWSRSNYHKFFVLAGPQRQVNPIYPLAKQIHMNYFNEPIDELSNDWIQCRDKIKKRFYECKWNKVYDFIEFLISTNFININEQIALVEANAKRSCFRDDVNEALEKELSAYRLITKGLFVPITDEIEINSVNESIDESDNYKNVHVHLCTALGLFSDRINPDYRNSVKESISAVEAVCKVITGDEHGTLGGMLKKLEGNGILMHSAFKESINKLYGYTSDKNGIRHCLTDESTVDYADAKYMLVVCSAFCNFLLAKLSVKTRTNS